MTNRSDVLSGFFWLGISIFICIESFRSDFGTFHSPGPGFFPFLSGATLGVFAIILVVTSRLKKKERGKITDLWKGGKWNKAISVLISLLLYPVFLPIMGYFITTFGLMTFLLDIMGRRRLWLMGVNAFIIVFASYLVFCVFLDVRLPKGIFGF